MQREPIESSLIGVPAKTTRLSLREFASDDRDAIITLHQDPRVRALLVDDFPLDDARLAHLFIERIQAYYRQHPGLGIWCAERWASTLSEQDAADPDISNTFSEEALRALTTPEPHFIGWFNLIRVNDRPDELEIGCRLQPAVWGSGLVLDGADMLLEHAFEQLHQPHVWGICHPEHRSVHHVLLTQGFTDDGVRPCANTLSRWFCIDARTWQSVKHIPRRVRQREALKRMP